MSLAGLTLERPICGWRGSLTLAAAALALLAASAGCEPSPRTQRHVRMRETGVQRTVDVWATREAARPDRLTRSLAFIPVNMDRHATRLERMGRRVEDWQQRDCRRWRERGPVYLDKAGRLLWAHPEQVEGHAVIMFF